MYYWFLILLLLLAVCALGVYRARLAGSGFVPPSAFIHQRRQASAVEHTLIDAQLAYRAVSIQCGQNACEAARRLEGRRGLHRQIPRVPLSNCDAAVCTCRYKQHTDRRHQEDRREVYSRLGAQLPDGVVERRANNDRRCSAIERDMATFRFQQH